jgi:hypothetical protein
MQHALRPRPRATVVSGCSTTLNDRRSAGTSKKSESTQFAAAKVQLELTQSIAVSSYLTLGRVS